MLSIIITVLILVILFIQIAKNILVYVKIPKEPRGYLVNLYTPESYEKSRFYYRNLAVMEIAKYSVKSIALITCIALGGFNYLDMWLRNDIGDSHYIIYGTIFLVVYSAFDGVLDWPFKAWEKIINEKVSGRVHNTFDGVVEVVSHFSNTLASLLSTLLVSAFFFPFMIYFLDTINFWVVFQLNLMLIIGLSALPELYNRIIIPFKHKLEPCTDSSVISSMNKLTNMMGYKKPLIQVLKNGTGQANALVSGRKNKMRIILDPKLLKEYPQNEIEAVLAHEFGHLHHRHPAKGVLTLFAVFMIVLGLILAVFYIPELAYHFNMQNTGIHTSLLIVMLLLQPIGLVAKVLVNAQGQKKEKQADIFAVRLLKDAQGLVSAFKRMYQTNIVHPNMHWLPLLLDHSHPPLTTRIKYLQEEAKKTS